MLGSSTEYRNNPAYYYCHVCNAKRTQSQVSLSDTGDILCLSCQSFGFVEKVTYEDNDQPSTFYSNLDTTTTRHNVDPFTSDPFASVFGVPLNVFIQDALRGTLSSHFTSNVPFNTQNTSSNTLNIGFNNNEFHNMFQRTLFGPFTNIPRRNNGRLQFFQGDFSRIINSFISNPFDEHAMNQILQYVMDNDPNRYGPPPAAKHVIDTLEEDTIDDDLAKSLESCAICTEDFKVGERIHWIERDKALCGHAFHVDCIIPWLKQHNTCPVCRYELPTDDELYNKQREYLRSRLTEEVQRNVGSTQSSMGDLNSPGNNQ